MRTLAAIMSIAAIVPFALAARVTAPLGPPSPYADTEAGQLKFEADCADGVAVYEDYGDGIELLVPETLTWDRCRSVVRERCGCRAGTVWMPCGNGEDVVRVRGQFAAKLT